MTDRNVQYPYRFHVRPVPGTDDICEIIPAPGAVYEDGTFWNKQNVLQDITAALYDKGPDATPDEIFAAIRPLITNAKALIATGSYVGTSFADWPSYQQTTYTDWKTVTVGFTPKFVFLTSQQNEICDIGDSGRKYFRGGIFAKDMPLNVKVEATTRLLEYAKIGENGFLIRNVKFKYNDNSVAGQYTYSALADNSGEIYRFFAIG